MQITKYCYNEKQLYKISQRNFFDNKRSDYSFTSISLNYSTDNNAHMLIESYFSSWNTTRLLYSVPTFKHTNDKVTIHLFYFVAKSLNFKDKFIPLANSLSTIYGKEVSLVFTRIHYPYLNSSIFAQYLAHNAPSNTFMRFRNSILTYPSKFPSKLPSYICGIKIEVSGRLLTERVVPRKTKKSYQFGTASCHKIDYAKYTTKNYLGAFTIKVWISQRIT